MLPTRICALAIVLALLTGCADPRPATTELGGQTMGTTWSVKLVEGSSELSPDSLRASIEAELEGVNAAMSTYRDDSALSRFNRNPSTDWQPQPAALTRVIAAAQEISDLSSGAFDITVGPLVNLWGFGPGAATAVVPDDAAIARTLAQVGYRKLALRQDPPALRKTVPNLYVDLSAIAKGFGVDRVAQVLQNAGVGNYLVEIGGELRGRGNSGRGTPWRIAVEKPDSDGRAIHQVVELADASMATSGDYRNFFVDRGRRYSHTIDAATGRPVAHSLASVTVIADSCMRADGLATALMALGPDAGFALAEREGIAALFIERTDTGFRDRATDPFKRIVEETRNNA